MTKIMGTDGLTDETRRGLAPKAESKGKVAGCTNRLYEPFNEEVVANLPLDAYGDTTMFDTCEGCHWLALSALSDGERNKLSVIAKAQLAGKKPNLSALTVAEQNIVAALVYTQMWQMSLASQYRDFVAAFKGLKADYEARPEAYQSGIDISNCSEDKYDTDLDLPLESAWRAAMPEAVDTRITNGCIWVSDKRNLDDRWTTAEKAFIAAHMRYNEVLNCVSLDILHLLEHLIEDYHVAESKSSSCRHHPNAR